MATRAEVYSVIDGERAYQAKWDTCESKGRHTVTEWLVYMQDYLSEAINMVSREAEPACHEKALHNIRKITAMGVACMEQNGAPPRS
jgi:hypothetical protein